MRKTTLLFTLMAFIGSSFAQQAQQARQDHSGRKITKNQVQAPATKATGDVFWSEDFAKADWGSTVDEGTYGGFLNISDVVMPNTWWIEDNTADASKKSEWHWSDVGPRGVWTVFKAGLDNLVPANRYLTDFEWPVGNTTDNGFIILESDFFNTTDLGGAPTAYIELDSYLYLGPVDCSSKHNVIVSFNTLFRFCCANAALFDLQVSNNFDPLDPTAATWSSYTIDKITPQGDFTYLDERAVKLNVSKDAGLESSVHFRFNTTGSADYFAIIDDFKLTEGPKDDIMAIDGWADYMEEGEDDYFMGGYSQIPLSLISNFTSFRMAVYNNGVNEAKNVKLTTKLHKDGDLVETLVSAPKNIVGISYDTLQIPTTYKPDALGTYQISSTISMEGTDELPDNNKPWGYEYMVTKDTYSRVRHGEEEKFGSAGPKDWDKGGMEGDILAVIYDIEKGTIADFKSIGVYMYPTTRTDELAAIAAGEFQMKACAYKYDATIGDWGDWVKIDGLVSDLYTVKTDDLGTWVNLPFIDAGESTQGDGAFLVGIETYTGTDKVLSFQIGDDAKGIKQYRANRYYSTSYSQWWWITNNYAIDLIIDYVADATETELQNVSIYPNPFDNTLTLKNLNNVTNIIISNVLGQAIMTVNDIESTVSISTSNLTNGVYLITIVDANNNMRTERVVKH